MPKHMQLQIRIAVILLRCRSVKVNHKKWKCSNFGKQTAGRSRKITKLLQLDKFIKRKADQKKTAVNIARELCEENLPQINCSTVSSRLKKVRLVAQQLRNP